MVNSEEVETDSVKIAEKINIDEEVKKIILSNPESVLKESKVVTPEDAARKAFIDRKALRK